MNNPDYQSRAAIGCLSIGLLACGTVVAIGEGVNFIRSCFTENAVRMLIDVDPVTLAQCLQETPNMLRSFLER